MPATAHFSLRLSQLAIDDMFLKKFALRN